MKNKLVLFTLLALLSSAKLSAQAEAQIDNINKILDTIPYYEIRGLDYSIKYHLPDTTKGKIIDALNRKLPMSFMDKVLNYPAVVLENIKSFAWQQCENDTACFEKVYAEHYAMNVEKDKISYSNRCFSPNLILAYGSWEITEAVPYLENELKREYCREFGGKEVVEMALAKLGNDSIKQHLIERHTLRYAMKHTTLDTINDNFPYYAGKDNWETINILNEGFKVAVYLKNKTILLNLLNLIYIKGRDNSNISESYTVSYFVNNFQHLFYKHPNDTILRKICNDYVLAIWDLDNKKLSKKEQKELDTLLSTAYRTKVKELLREWVIENVNFE